MSRRDGQFDVGCDHPAVGKDHAYVGGFLDRIAETIAQADATAS